jgi:hypothetical protein
MRYAMSGRWETHRGDEWWYTDFWCKFDAGFNSAYPGTLSIDRAEIKQGQLTETRLHNLLWSTQQQFKDKVVEVCGLSELVTVLLALKGYSLIILEQRESTYSKCVKVTNVVAPPQSPAKASVPVVKKQWWQFW